MAERLLVTMEAENELTPAIATAFRARPWARAGWAKMTAAQCRSELMGVFYYQTPEARERRIGKLCEAGGKTGLWVVMGSRCLPGGPDRAITTSCVLRVT